MILNFNYLNSKLNTMKKKFTVIDSVNAVIDILTVKRETPRFYLLNSAQEKTAELFIKIETLQRQQLKESQIKPTAIIFLN